MFPRSAFFFAAQYASGRREWAKAMSLICVHSLQVRSCDSPQPIKPFNRSDHKLTRGKPPF